MTIADPCTRYGINNGCDSGCPVLNDGDCTIEPELAEETDWYAEWAVEAGSTRGLNILEEMERRKPKLPTAADDYARAMEILFKQGNRSD